MSDIKDLKRLSGALFEQAVTHRSVGANNNERLEFLGDALLNAAIAQLLFEHHPKANEGELTRARASLVCEASLADVAKNLRLFDHMRVGPGELRSGGYRRDSVLADALEAIIAAVFLNHGWQACRDLIQKFFSERLSDPSAFKVQKDAKTLLQELLQSKNMSVPFYELIAAEGEDHQKQFTVTCRIDGGMILTTGVGSSLKRAEMMAASLALSQCRALDIST